MTEADRVRNLLAAVLVGAFVSSLPLFIFKDIPAGNRDIITYIMGQLSGMALMALGFYFTNKVGQDALDTTRAVNTGKLADAFTAAAQANVDPQPVVVTNPASNPVQTEEAK